MDETDLGKFSAFRIAKARFGGQTRCLFRFSVVSFARQKMQQFFCFFFASRTDVQWRFARSSHFQKAQRRFGFHQVFG